MKKIIVLALLCLLISATFCSVAFAANGTLCSETSRNAKLAFAASNVAETDRQTYCANDALQNKNGTSNKTASVSSNIASTLENKISLSAANFALASTQNAVVEGEFSTTAQACCVMERSSERVLFEKNAHQALPMASTTKIVTALTVLNNCANLERVVEVPRQACGVEGSSIYLREGEHLTVRELLLGLMLRSGNDCAVALALEIGGSVENFAALMNQTAASLGCTESNFVTPHGLHDENHYTTAADLAKITCAALNNEDFRQIVGTQRAKISNEGMDYQRVLINKNKLLASFDGADGVKTGYTKKAGRCFVGSATRNGMGVVVVVLNCGPMFEETAQMLNTAFATYTLQNVIPKHKLCGAEYIKGKPTYYFCEEAYYYPLKSSEKATLKITLEKNVKQAEVFVDGARVHVQQLKSQK